LQAKVLQNFDEGFFEAGYFESILYTPYQTNGIYFSTDVLEQATDERWGTSNVG